MAPIANNAKISPPSTASSIRRERLLTQLDATVGHATLWLSAPPGAGKTLLLANYAEHRAQPCLWYQIDPTDNDPAVFFQYLAAAVRSLANNPAALPSFSPEHLPALPAFARNFFTALAKGLPATTLLVFDDYHEAQETSPLHGIFRHGLSVLPTHLRAVILSRGAPPPALTRLTTNSKILLFPGESLRLSLEESLQIAASRDSSVPATKEEKIRALHAQTGGWAAGFILSLAHQGEPGTVLSREDLFDYFAGEILDGLPPATEDFLLRTALFPEFTAAMAHYLTDLPQTERLLNAMVRNNQFTTFHGEERVYRYHDLFRHCLLERAQRSFPEAQLKALRAVAATILLGENYFHEGFKLLADAGMWEEAAELVRAHAGQLTALGQFSTLTDWLSRFPAGHLEADPWLLFWSGSSLFPVQGPKTARPWFENAYGKFLPGDDAAGIYLSWCGVVECRLYEWDVLKPLDAWLNDLRDIRRRFPHYPHPDIEARVVTAMFSALCFRRPWSDEIHYWTREAKKIQQHSTNPMVRLILARQLLYWWGWKGDFQEAASLLEEFGRNRERLQGSMLETVHIRNMMAFYYWMTGRATESMAMVDEAIAEVEREGMPALYHLLLSTAVFVNFDLGRLEEGRQHLDRMESLLSEQVLEIGNFHYMKALEMAHRGNRQAALLHIDLTLRAAFRAGAPLQTTFSLLAKGQILREMEAYGKSARILRRAYRLARWIDSAWLLARYHLVTAELCFARGTDTEGIEHLRQGFILCRENRILHFEWWRPQIMAELCARALAAGIEIEFVLEMVRSNNLAAEASPLEFTDWPWPVRIFFLGRFEIMINDQILISSGKTQKKPLELLKALVSLGGREVHENQLIDCLWPDADGDLGHNSFSVTLARLRRLLGHEQALLVQGGRLSIDPRYCWVDGMALERLLEDGAQSWKKAEGGDAAGPNDFAQAVRLTEKALCLYRGHFLPGETALPWTVSTRERLRGKFIRGVARLGQHWEKTGELEKAVDCYLQGLERDDLVEEFYQRLMLCYHRLGRSAMGVEIYRRCRLRLASGLGLRPCAETEAIHLTLQG